MMPQSRLILGIETTCDETACAIVECDASGARPPRVLANTIATQHELHAPYAGVVPEIASRAHVERWMPTLRTCLRDAAVRVEDIHAVAVADRPGLIGSLLVGLTAAKALAWSLEKPLIPVDHVHAHLFAAFIEPRDKDPLPVAEHLPAIGLAVSGGHTALYHVASPTSVKLLGATIDDALGEAFDKAATLLGLGHPGGPNLERLAQAGDPAAIELPVARLSRDSIDLSFSGLKTAVLYAVRGVPKRGGHFEKDASDLSDQQRADIAAAFQAAACKAIELKLRRAIEHARTLAAANDGSTAPRAVLAGGGVIANRAIRASIQRVADKAGLPALLAPAVYCTDNAAMIAFMAGLLPVPDQARVFGASPRATVER